VRGQDQTATKTSAPVRGAGPPPRPGIAASVSWHKDRPATRYSPSTGPVSRSARKPLLDGAAATGTADPPDRGHRSVSLPRTTPCLPCSTRSIRPPKEFCPNAHHTSHCARRVCRIHALSSRAKAIPSLFQTFLAWSRVTRPSQLRYPQADNCAAPAQERAAGSAGLGGSGQEHRSGHISGFGSLMGGDCL